MSKRSALGFLQCAEIVPHAYTSDCAKASSGWRHKIASTPQLLDYAFDRRDYVPTRNGGIPKMEGACCGSCGTRIAGGKKNNAGTLQFKSKINNS
ncbi:MAG TPA: hypothetical protein VKU19_10775 [Bryobacteraceae bacterium]|nr:hypothetical protein [Bryobacteraceae bacterium]